MPKPNRQGSPTTQGSPNQPEGSPITAGSPLVGPSPITAGSPQDPGSPQTAGSPYVLAGSPAKTAYQLQRLQSACNRLIAVVDDLVSKRAKQPLRNELRAIIRRYHKDTDA